MTSHPEVVQPGSPAGKHAVEAAGRAPFGSVAQGRVGAHLLTGAMGIMATRELVRAGGKHVNI